MSKINAGNRVLAEKKWCGYSLEELRYRRALNEVEIAVEKDKGGSKNSIYHQRVV